MAGSGPSSGTLALTAPPGTPSPFSSCPLHHAPVPSGYRHRPGVQLTHLHPGAHGGPGPVQLDRRGSGRRVWRQEPAASHTTNAGCSQLPPSGQLSGFSYAAKCPQALLHAPLSSEQVWVTGGPHQAVPSLDTQGPPRARTGTWEADQEVPRTQPLAPRACLGPSLTQKSKLYLIFRNSPPTIAARWITCVGRTFSNRARVCAASLDGAGPSGVT